MEIVDQTNGYIPKDSKDYLIDPSLLKNIMQSKKTIQGNVKKTIDFKINLDDQRKIRTSVKNSIDF